MRPCPCPEDLALYAGDDYARPEEIASHLLVCPCCAEFVEELRSDRELLRAFDVSDASLEFIRDRVLTGIAPPRRRHLRTAVGLAAAGVAAAVVLWTLSVPAPRLERARAPTPPTIATVLPTPATPRPKRAVKRKYDDLLARMDALMAPEPLPPVEGIVIPTADPNLTILLVEERTGDEE